MIKKSVNQKDIIIIPNTHVPKSRGSKQELKFYKRGINPEQSSFQHSSLSNR